MKLYEKYRQELLDPEPLIKRCECSREATHFEEHQTEADGIPFEWREYFCPFCLMKKYDFSVKELQDRTFLESFNIFEL